MTKKKKLLLPIAIICLIISITTIIALSNQPSGTIQNTGQIDDTSKVPEPTKEPDGPLFVVPESSLGTLGLVSALMAAFGLFAIKNKKIRLR
jgi:hypothetical protein